MLHNTLQINATQMAPERRGAAVATFASCFYFGQSVGVSLPGLVVERVGTAAVIASALSACWVPPSISVACALATAPHAMT